MIYSGSHQHKAPKLQCENCRTKNTHVRVYEYGTLARMENIVLCGECAEIFARILHGGQQVQEKQEALPR